MGISERALLRPRSSTFRSMCELRSSIEGLAGQPMKVDDDSRLLQYCLQNCNRSQSITWDAFRTGAMVYRSDNHHLHFSAPIPLSKGPS